MTGPLRTSADSPQPTQGGATQETVQTTTDSVPQSKTGSAERPAKPPADPVELTVEYGQALERARNDKDMDAVVVAFRPNYDAAKPHVRKIMDGLLSEQRKRVAKG
jgi:ribosome-binding protein aMBF1 (putative translation factor)